MVKLEGVFTALVTPFANDRLDEPTLRTRIGEQRTAGISGLVVGATTGEGPALEPAEWKRLLEISIEEKGELTIVANTGTNNTAHSIARTVLAHDMGADAALAITPYYNKPTQEGLIRHFLAIATASPLPLMLYNVPSRTGCELLPDSCANLLKAPSIKAMKQAVGNLDHFTAMKQIVGDRWTLLSGEDSLMLPILALGGHGVVSCASNVVPEVMVGLYRASQRNDWDEARRLHYAVFDLIDQLFVETSPGPIKEAMKMRDRSCGEVRLPLAPLSAKRHDGLRKALHKAMEAV